MKVPLTALVVTVLGDCVDPGAAAGIVVDPERVWLGAAVSKAADLRHVAVVDVGLPLALAHRALLRQGAVSNRTWPQYAPIATSDILYSLCLFSVTSE